MRQKVQHHLVFFYICFTFYFPHYFYNSSLCVYPGQKVLEKKEGATGPDFPDKDGIIKTYDACKKCRTEGDYAGFYRAAIDVLEKTSFEESIIIDDLKSVCEKVEFGSYVPTSEEIEPVFRRITKAMEKIFSDKTNYELEYKKYCK